MIVPSKATMTRKVMVSIDKSSGIVGEGLAVGAVVCVFFVGVGVGATIGARVGVAIGFAVGLLVGFELGVVVGLCVGQKAKQKAKDLEKLSVLAKELGLALELAH